MRCSHKFCDLLNTGYIGNTNAVDSGHEITRIQKDNLPECFASKHEIFFQI